MDFQCSLAVDDDDDDDTDALLARSFSHPFSVPSLLSLSLSVSLSLSLFPADRTYGSPAASSKIAAFDLVSDRF